VQTCRRELLDRTLIWNRSRLLHALREFEQFYYGHSGELQVLTGAAAGGEQWLSKARRTLGTVTGAAEICAAPKPRLGCTTTSSSATD
jgi:hypothetical protein